MRMNPHPLVKKKDLRALKPNLYDSFPITPVRWLFWRVFTFERPFRPGSKLKRPPPPEKKRLKNQPQLVEYFGPGRFVKSVSLLKSEGVPPPSLLDIIVARTLAGRSYGNNIGKL